jgi:DNA repair exonuclease SbcCD ATPase subunit
MGEISDAEYYQALAEYRDKYLGETTAEWRRFTLETKKYRDSLNEDALAPVNAGKLGISERNFYDDWSYAEQEADAWKALKETLEGIYAQDLINREDYEKELREINHAIFTAEKELTDKREKELKAQADAVNKANKEKLKILQEQRSAEEKERKKAMDNEISALQNQLKAYKKDIDARIKQTRENENSLSEQWAARDRSESLADLRERQRVFAPAVTVEGIAEYERINAEIKRLEREEILAGYQERTAEAAEGLQAEYAAYEEQINNQIEALKADYSKYQEKNQELIRQAEIDLADVNYDQLSELRDIKNLIGNIDLSALAAAIGKAAAGPAVSQATQNYTTNNNVSVANNVSSIPLADLMTQSLNLIFRGGTR